MAAERVPTIAITGSASGIGAATRARLERAGAQVIGVDVAKGQEVHADLSSAEGRRYAVAAVLRRSGGALDGLVASAGLGMDGADAAAVVSVNYFGVRDVLVGLRDALAANGSSRALVLSSIAVAIYPDIAPQLVDACLKGEESSARELGTACGSDMAYAASKLAIARWARRAAVTGDWIGAGIRLNVLSPGITDTPMPARALQDDGRAAQLGALPIPIGRMALPDEQAAWAEFLIGEGGGFACGGFYSVDGGTEAALRGEDWPTPCQAQPQNDLYRLATTGDSP
jgi:NAD(P)-dependent dehydrogenase (short-subunit alcohol dehydrogenase family)